MSTLLSQRERALALAWKKTAEDTDANILEVMRVVTAILSAGILTVSKTREDALEGVEKLNNDLKHEVDRKFGAPK